MRGIKTIFLHLIVWIIYVLFAILVYGFTYSDIRSAASETIASYIISAAVFYSHSEFLLPVFFARKKYLLYSSLIGLLLISNFLLRYLTATYTLPFITGKPSSTIAASFIHLFVVFSWQYFTFMFYSTGYWFARRQIQQEKTGRQQDKIEAENEKLQLENVALRAQINPHFFVNTMEYFRVEVANNHPEVSEGIEAMTNFVKSSIVATDDNGKIQLFDELRAMDSLITIFKKRYPNANIDYTNKVYENIPIIPHVLVAPVENAFKHGTYTDIDSKLIIHIEQTDDDLLFNVSNKKGRRFKDESRGIGMRYIKSQLDKSYPGQYLLDIQDNGEYYYLSLTIQNIMKHGYHVLYN